MSDQLKPKLAAVTKSALPWQKGIAWWVVLIEGIFLIGAGLFMFFVPEKTYNLLGWIIAIILVAGGALSVYSAYIEKEKNLSKMWTMIHGLVGLTIGVIVIVILLLNALLMDAGVIILSLGCLAYGGVGLYMTLVDSQVNKRIAIIAPIFFLLLGVLLLLQFLGVGAFVTTIQIISFIILVAGIILLLWALIIKRESSR